jgi:hypothetical protein
LDIGHCRAFCRTVSRYFATQPYRIRHCFPFQFPGIHLCQCPAGGGSRSPLAPRARAEPGCPSSPPAPQRMARICSMGSSNMSEKKFVKSSPRATVRTAMGSPVLGIPSRLIVTVARRGFGTQAQGPIRDSFVLGSAHRAHTSRHAIPVEEPAAHNVAPGVRLWSRSKKLWQVQEVPTHTANVENLVTVAQNLPNTSQPSRLARGRLSRAWSAATWSEVVHTK